MEEYFCFQNVEVLLFKVPLSRYLLYIWNSYAIYALNTNKTLFFFQENTQVSLPLSQYTVVNDKINYQK